MSRNLGRTVALAATLVLIGVPARAQYYGRGYWGGYGGGQTVAGNYAQGMGVYAAGVGRYNLETARARAINADTAMRFNQYLYQSRVEGSRIYHENLAKERAQNEKNYEAIRARIRDNPTAVDVERGDALNVILDELSDPKVSSKAIYYGGRTKLGGEAIRDIPFSFASAAISISVHQLTQGGAPDVLKEGKEFAPDREALRAVAADLRREGDATGTHKPETIRKAKDLILATRAKVEAVLPKGSADRQAAEKYLKALYGFVRMLETPAVDVLLAGVEKHPEATLGDLLKFMATFNLRFGAAETPRQKEVFQRLYPMLAQLRSQVAGSGGSAPTAPPVDHDAPIRMFDEVSYDQIDGKAPIPPVAPTAP